MKKEFEKEVVKEKLDNEHDVTPLERAALIEGEAGLLDPDNPEAEDFFREVE